MKKSLTENRKSLTFSGKSGVFNQSINQSAFRLIKIPLLLAACMILFSAAQSSANTIYAATTGGLSISADGGNTFSNKTTADGLGNNNVYRVYIVGSTVYATTYGAGLSISTDGGTSFTNKTTTNGLGSNNVWAVYAVGSTVYAATNGNGLSISTNGGDTFINKTTANGLGSDTMRGVFSVSSTVYAATNVGLSISTNGGNTFTNKTTTNGLGSDGVRHVYAVNSTIYAATIGGLSISVDGGTSFSNKTIANGLGNNNVVGVYAVGSTVYAATFGGLSISSDSGNTFSNKTTANGLGNNIVWGVYAVDSMVYAATNGGGLSISADGGNTFINKTTTDGLGSNVVYGVYVIPGPPVAPIGLGANPVSQTQIDLSWTDNSTDETGFRIYRNSVEITPSPAKASSAGTGTVTYNDTGLTCNTAYTYTVKATNAGGDSAASPSAIATTSACTVPVTAGVTLTGIGSITGSTVLATGNATGAGIGERGFYWWIPPTTATHFGGSESGLIPEGYGAGSFSLNITGLRPGHTYHLKAYVKVGGQIITSDEQLFTTATTGATGKMAPTVLTDTVNYSVSGNSITVSGEITDVGSSPVNVYGFVYAPHSAPFTGDDMLKTGDRAYAMWEQTPLYQGMKFTGTIKNIPPGKWYLRAYAHNTNQDSSADQPESLSYGQEISFTIACTPETCIPGDVNGDGKVSLDDAMLVLRILAGIPVQNINLNADVNGDGKIGLEELGFILQKVAGVR